uniref:FTH domain-containing protein n=1 Tax=Caenorhabditis tropicalis TaxID=1561998 RepID=A0A1I7T3S0_9PELO
MNNKPLTYDSLKTVIQYMDPNTRLLLSSRIPSIRSVERAVPLKIEKLLIGNHYIKVNKTLYNYGIFKTDCKNKPPYKINGHAAKDRFVCDVNELLSSEIHVTKREINSSASYVIERIKYTGNFHKAEESLREFMFGKRQHAVRVDDFDIIQRCPIQMPCDLKIRIKTLSLTDNVASNLEVGKPAANPFQSFLKM